jgi:hypothetical protein
VSERAADGLIIPGTYASTVLGDEEADGAGDGRYAEVPEEGE